MGRGSINMVETDDLSQDLFVVKFNEMEFHRFQTISSFLSFILKKFDYMNWSWKYYQFFDTLIITPAEL